MARRATAVTLVCLLAAGPLSSTPASATLDGFACAHQGHAFGARSGRGGQDPRPLGDGQAEQMLYDLAQRIAGRAVPNADIVVPTWVHVLGDGRREASEQSVRSQIDTLNAAYGGRRGGADTHVTFQLDGITTTRNATWFSDPLGHEAAMKTKLRRGGAETLNLYIGQLTNLVLGYSTYPYWYAVNPKLDGVVIDWRSLPGGSLRNFDRGYTAVHEIGHWLGLFHTFENGCEEPGDGVADTPPEDRPTAGCPTGKDTCTGPGLDPVHNFMDYSHDRCMSEFTPGQAARMHEMWTAYRESARNQK